MVTRISHSKESSDLRERKRKKTRWEDFVSFCNFLISRLPENESQIWTSHDKGRNQIQIVSKCGEREGTTCEFSGLSFLSFLFLPSFIPSFVSSFVHLFHPFYISFFISISFPVLYLQFSFKVLPTDGYISNQYFQTWFSDFI